MVGVDSLCELMLKIPFVVRHFDVRNLRGIKRNAGMSSDSGHELALNDGYISDDAAIPKSYVHNLVGHASLGLLQEKLTPVFWKTRLHQLF